MQKPIIARDHKSLKLLVFVFFCLLVSLMYVINIQALQTGVMVVFERGLDAKVPVQASSLVTVAVMLGIVYIKNRKDIKDYYAKKYPADYLPK
jgi:hypothetical protein